MSAHFWDPLVVVSNHALIQIQKVSNYIQYLHCILLCFLTAYLFKPITGNHFHGAKLLSPPSGYKSKYTNFGTLVICHKLAPPFSANKPLSPVSDCQKITQNMGPNTAKYKQASMHLCLSDLKDMHKAF